MASGIPPPRVTWAKDGSSVTGYNKTRFLLSNLLIDATSEEDSGTYRCVADNGVGEPGAAAVLYNVQVFGECLLQTFSLAFSLVCLACPEAPNPRLRVTCLLRGHRGSNRSTERWRPWVPGTRVEG